jgi:hypothetical protein
VPLFQDLKTKKPETRRFMPLPGILAIFGGLQAAAQFLAYISRYHLEIVIETKTLEKIEGNIP